MAYGAFADTKSRYRDLEELVDYREYEGAWTLGFEENWLKPRLKALGYSHVRFFGGTAFEYDGSFRQRVCELAMPGSASAEFFVYGWRERSLDGCDAVNPTIQMKENSRCT